MAFALSRIERVISTKFSRRLLTSSSSCRQTLGHLALQVLKCLHHLSEKVPAQLDQRGMPRARNMLDQFSVGAGHAALDIVVRELETLRRANRPSADSRAALSSARRVPGTSGVARMVVRRIFVSSGFIEAPPVVINATASRSFPRDPGAVLACTRPRPRIASASSAHWHAQLSPAALALRLQSTTLNHPADCPSCLAGEPAAPQKRPSACSVGLPFPAPILPTGS